MRLTLVRPTEAFAQPRRARVGLGVNRRSNLVPSGQVAVTKLGWLPRGIGITPTQPSRTRGDGLFLGALARWALRLKARHERRAEAPDLALVLLRRLGQLPIRIYQSWLSLYSRFDPNFSLSLFDAPATGQVERSVTEQVFVHLFNRFEERHARLHNPARSTILGSRVARHSPLARPVAPFARQSMLSVTGQRLELSTSTRRQRIDRRETKVTEISRRLAERVQRIPETLPPPGPMALRSELRAVRRPPAFEETSGATRWRDPPNRPPPVPPTAVPPVNIDQLTAQVLKQIDRRVVARRERLGQV
jgi:hypothetical protein